MENGNWLDKEIEEIICEQKRARKNRKMRDNDTFKLFIMIIICAFFFVIQCHPLSATIYPANDYCRNEGVNWHCQGCGHYCWSNAKNWKGEYHCSNCGRKK